MNFYSVILRKSKEYWVALCLENGLVGQGDSQQQAINKILEAISSFEVYQSDPNVYSAAISIQELHEFLTIEETTDIYELRKVYA